MSFQALADADLDIVCRPIENWPGPRTPESKLVPSRFEASLHSTVDTLRRELEKLNATNIVLGLSINQGQLRLDGLPRADARPDDGAVMVAFDSTHGALRYACDQFTAGHWGRSASDWEHNLRAIALGLEALRKVDRYGIARDGQQYRGYAALPAPIPMSSGATHLTRDDAVDELAELLDASAAEVDDMASRGVLEAVVRRRLHPDRTGDEAPHSRALDLLPVVSR